MDEHAATPAERTYLAVPYADREQAKRAGARWDAKRRAWYTRELTTRLQRWLPLQREPDGLDFDPRREFAATMQRLGLVTDHLHPIADGQPHRTAVTDDKPGRKSGFYVLHVDGLPAGYALNHRTGEGLRWNANAPLSDEDRAELRARTAALAARREHERQNLQQRVALTCERRLGQLVPLAYGDTTAYLTRKGVVAHRGVFASQDGDTTVVPARDISGRLYSLQTITADGGKRFAHGGRVAGCFHPLGGVDALDRAAQRGIVLVSEGYATAATVQGLAQGVAGPSTPVATVTAFHASNLPTVAQALRQRYPQASLVIAGDDDRNNRLNAGRCYAEQAARQSQAALALPPFSAIHPAQLSDWNDLDQFALTQGYNRSTSRRVLQQALREACALRSLSQSRRPAAAPSRTAHPGRETASTDGPDCKAETRTAGRSRRH